MRDDRRDERGEVAELRGVCGEIPMYDLVN